MMEKINKKQIKSLKKGIDGMAESEEQFILMIFKNKDGADNVTEYSYNMIKDKINFYLSKAMKRAIIKDEDAKCVEEVA